MANIGFIGLGNMGGPMAANLVRAGHSVSVFDLSKEAVATLVDSGSHSCAIGERSSDRRTICYQYVTRRGTCRRLVSQRR